jgi:hypothetical protein
MNREKPTPSLHPYRGFLENIRFCSPLPKPLPRIRVTIFLRRAPALKFSGANTAANEATHGAQSAPATQREDYLETRRQKPFSVHTSGRNLRSGTNFQLSAHRRHLSGEPHPR